MSGQTTLGREYANLMQLIGVSAIFTDSLETREVVKELEDIAADYNSKKDRSNGIYVKAQQVVKKLKNGYDGNFATYDQNGHLVEIPLRTLSRVFFYRIGLKDYAMVLRQQPDTFTGIFTQTYLESNNINK